ncbi:DEKNAAC104376 [Brettanomyces naardenensis]|uniref:Copper transport protein n=1 Tax=Brettanomyces naardenensis TaxID=13370 RepID=A0A448YQM0_BRENA|nr:DEKNAAC104376 [Brettanomyces naardenensis]
MYMGTTYTGTAGQPIPTSAASDGSTDSSSSDMSMMMMNEYFTSYYKDYPVLFKNLHANSRASAFGIFVLIFVACFFFRGFGFLGSYLEHNIFHNYTNSVLVEKEDCECDPAEESDGGKKIGPEHETTTTPLLLSSHSNKSYTQILKELFFPGMVELCKDSIRLVIAFVVVMIGYALMLTTMSFVLVYFFAVCSGLAFSEVFFNRLAIVLGVNRTGGPCSGMH